MTTNTPTEPEQDDTAEMDTEGMGDAEPEPESEGGDDG